MSAVDCSWAAFSSQLGGHQEIEAPNLDHERVEPEAGLLPRHAFQFWNLESRGVSSSREKGQAARTLCRLPTAKSLTLQSTEPIFLDRMATKIL